MNPCRPTRFSNINSIVIKIRNLLNCHRKDEVTRVNTERWHSHFTRPLCLSLGSSQLKRAIITNIDNCTKTHTHQCYRKAKQSHAVMTHSSQKIVQHIVRCCSTTDSFENRARQVVVGTELGDSVRNSMCSDSIFTTFRLYSILH